MVYRTSLSLDSVNETVFINRVRHQVGFSDSLLNIEVWFFALSTYSEERVCVLFFQLHSVFDVAFCAFQPLLATPPDSFARSLGTSRG